MEILITPAQLDHALRTRDDVRVLDVRWSLGGPPGRPLHEAGHIPGAVYADLDTELSRHGAPEEGRHPLPEPAALQEAARRWGVRAGDTVVAYDGGGSLAAARVWWLLRDAGIADVRILDGALPAWSAAGLPLETGAVVPTPGDVTLASGLFAVVDEDGAARVALDGVLLDARAGERYRGEVEPWDPRPGHIPGARSAPSSDALAADGTFRSPAELHARYAALGVPDADEVAVYCGSGVSAALEVAALAIAGIDAALYPGSWSAWSNRPELPAATGAEPGGA
ncbi:sulfurtransferase [Clavibacter nebraskensis]|uniref:sulfurtransferase n=1 Tax=Clavibacter nebraskensis TaxID=31963 RepID=UPI0012F73E48|nr:sulfurtransferase [Clavibacter nebraskensis]QGV67452.1 sulfurtransferase [Clavibacter nebraskensis]UKF28950.1 sulfurtransferase [Clavibacter nebraskensis]UQB13012.1 sulfurtransferase [Clavibacter nebraskensis]UQB15847.1 sulfurtransferase [Clavibacter nebraskensis]